MAAEKPERIRWEVFWKKCACPRERGVARRRIERTAAADVHRHQRLARFKSKSRGGKVRRLHAELKSSKLEQPQRQMIRQPCAFGKADLAAIAPIFGGPAADIVDRMIKYLVRKLVPLIIVQQLLTPKERCEQIRLGIAAPTERVCPVNFGGLRTCRKQRFLKVLLIERVQTLTGIFLPRKGNRLFDVVHFVPNL